jgi:hypothetical protein
MQNIPRTGAIIILLIFLVFVWMQPKPKPPVEFLHDTAYLKTTDSFYSVRKKIIQKHDTLYFYFLDSPYSTKLLDSTINLHRQLDAQGVE